MNISSLLDWNQWTTDATGDGTISFSGGVATISSGIGTGSAKVFKSFATSPGEVYELTFMARRFSGVDGTSGSAYVDWPSETSLKDRVEVGSPQWREYKIRYAVPLTSAHGSVIQLGVGVYGSLGGSIKVASPRISVAHTPFGSLRTLAHGLLQFSGTTPSVNVNKAAGGISALEYVSADKAIYVTIGRVSTNGIYSHPIFFAQMTPDGASGVIKLVPKVGNYDTATGKVKVQFIDTTTGAYVDITGLTLYFHFMALF